MAEQIKKIAKQNLFNTEEAEKDGQESQQRAILPDTVGQIVQGGIAVHQLMKDIKKKTSSQEEDAPEEEAPEEETQVSDVQPEMAETSFGNRVLTASNPEASMESASSRMAEMDIDDGQSVSSSLQEAIGSRANSLSEAVGRAVTSVKTTASDLAGNALDEVGAATAGLETADVASLLGIDEIPIIGPLIGLGLLAGTAAEVGEGIASTKPKQEVAEASFQSGV